MKLGTAAAASATLFILAGGAKAQAPQAPSLAPIFTDHAVLQRDKAIALWGRAAANATVSLNLSSDSRVLARRRAG